MSTLDSYRPLLESLIGKVLESVEVPTQCAESKKGYAEVGAVRLLIRGRTVYFLSESVVRNSIEELHLGFADSFKLDRWPGGPPVAWKQAFEVRGFIIAEALLLVDLDMIAVGLELIARSGSFVRLGLGELSQTVRVALIDGTLPESITS